MKQGRSMLLRAAAALLLLTALGITGFRAYAADDHAAGSYTPQIKEVEETEDYIVYGDTDSAAGFIFYPGAKVEEAAYAPIMDELAQAGVCCVVVKMPYHLAVFDVNAAERVMRELPEVEAWYIGGHSLGGAMAAAFAARHEQSLAGLILLAAYPTKEIKHLPVLSLYGSEDEVLNKEKYEKSASLAVHLTEYVIEGGNHAGFGNYGVQKGDGEAYLAREEQWQETVDYILNFIKK